MLFQWGEFPKFPKGNPYRFYANSALEKERFSIHLLMYNLPWNHSVPIYKLIILLAGEAAAQQGHKPVYGQVLKVFEESS